MGSELASDVLIAKRSGKILYLTLNRPERGNSLNPPTLAALRNAFVSAQDDKKIRVVHLTGSGTKDFCTGIDIQSVRDFSPEGKTNVANVAGDIATLIYHGKPTVVAINGRFMGMGTVFATAADYRLMRKEAIMQMPEVNFGAFPGASCIALMTRVCGVAWTRKILMSGSPFSGQDLIDAHITDEIVASDALMVKAKEIARILSRKNPQLLQLIKINTINMPDLEYMEGLKLETECANYYQWADPVKKTAEIRKKYSIEYSLTGDPEKLMKEYRDRLSDL